MRSVFQPKRTRTPRFLSAGMALALSCLPLGAALAEEPQKDGKDKAEEEEFRPELELGIHGGGHFFSRTNALGRAEQPTMPQNPAPQTLEDREAKEIERSLKHSGAVGARLGLVLSRHWIPEIEFLVAPTKTESERANVTVVAWRAHLMFQWTTGRVRPFVLGGLGALSGFSSNQMELRDATDPLFHAGAGLKIDFTKHIGMRIDGRVLLPTDLRRLMAPDYEALLGFYTRFGLGGKPTPPPDADSDGIPDAQDQCPSVAGVKENNGCPDKDSDGDGIVDRLDKCPDKAGTSEFGGCPPPDADGDGVPDAQDQCPNDAGVKENNGCPDKDQDSDGVVDRLDKCPAQAGVKEHDGCPPPDADGDGVPDAKDQCPDKPETKNGFQDDDGCPDQIPQKLKKFTGTIQGVNFETGKAVITKGSFPLLDRAVAVLKEFPEVRMEIAGHTDNVGAADFNRNLSQQRADAVRDYFVSKGVATERLVSKGYGPDKPIADNKTAAGKAKNRRVEFNLISSLDAPLAPAQAPAAPAQAPSAPAQQGAAPAQAPAAPAQQGAAPTQAPAAPAAPAK